LDGVRVATLLFAGYTAIATSNAFKQAAVQITWVNAPGPTCKSLIPLSPGYRRAENRRQASHLAK
jgi:hypothetical protein